jgi:hypothetical protein
LKPEPISKIVDHPIGVFGWRVVPFSPLRRLKSEKYLILFFPGIQGKAITGQPNKALNPNHVNILTLATIRLRRTMGTESAAGGLR